VGIRSEGLGVLKSNKNVKNLGIEDILANVVISTALWAYDAANNGMSIDTEMIMDEALLNLRRAMVPLEEIEHAEEEV
jgi:hypothetical protein